MGAEIVVVDGVSMVKRFDDSSVNLGSRRFCKFSFHLAFLGVYLVGGMMAG